MTAWIILFRGFGGATQLPVAQLRDVLAGAGFGDVTTYINSGNAVLASPLPREEVERGVAVACARDLGFAKAVHALSRVEWQALVDGNPYPAAVAAPTTLHAAVLATEPDPVRVAALRALAREGEGIAVRGRVAYLHTPDGLSRSRLGARFDKELGVANTARNWNTVRRLLAMVEAADPDDHT